MFGLVKCALVLTVAVAASCHSLGPNDVVFHLFTQANQAQSEPLLPSVNSIMASNFFSLSRPTVVSIHSFGESATGNFNAFFVPAHLSARDVNVLVVDWSAGSGMYSQGVAEAPQCGQVVANFINILISNFNYGANNVRIVGHGLGGHVAGIAARAINGVVPHVVALDPSLHGWTHHPQKLSTDAATVVEVLHTTSGILGYDLPLGHYDFYPNGGTHQNGCGIDTSCSHTYSHAFYAESLLADINNGPKFVATRCDGYDQAIVLQCSGARDANFGGLQEKSSANGGVFTFLTNPGQPFARD